MTAAVQKTIATETAPIWENLPEADVGAPARVLNEIVARGRAILDRPTQTPSADAVVR